MHDGSAMNLDARSPASRRYHLRGAEIDAWYAPRGWRAHVAAEQETVVIADERRVAAVTVRRVWASGLRLTPVDDAGDGLGLRTWLLSQGRLSVLTAEGTRVRSAAPRPLWFGAGEAASTAVEIPSRWLEIHTHAGRDAMRAPSPTVTPRSTPSFAGRALWRIVDDLLDHDAVIDARVAGVLALVVESLVEATIVDHRPLADDVSLAATDHFLRAVEAIHRGAADPTMTIGRLAQELSMSRAHMARVFREHGTTARSTMKSVRVALARRALLDDPAADPESVAANAGFSSARALRDALRGRHVDSDEIRLSSPRRGA